MNHVIESSFNENNISKKSNKNSTKDVIMTLEALKNVIKSNPGVEIQCIGHFKLLFGLTSGTKHEKIQSGALEIIYNVTQNQECVNDIAASEVISHLLLCLNTLTDRQLIILEILYALMSTTKIVKDALNKGMIL